jgi:uncharacterized protein (DUF2267 family)
MVAQLADELGTEDHENAGRVLRGYLQVVRDRLTINDAAQLAAQLPHLLRGVLYEGFYPGQSARADSRPRDVPRPGRRAGGPR